MEEEQKKKNLPHKSPRSQFSSTLIVTVSPVVSFLICMTEAEPFFSRSIYLSFFLHSKFKLHSEVPLMKPFLPSNGDAETCLAAYKASALRESRRAGVFFLYIFKDHL